MLSWWGQGPMPSANGDKMNKNITIKAIALVMLLILILFAGINWNRDSDTSSSSPTKVNPQFSDEADRNFTSLIAKGVDVNSGITIETSTPYSGQEYSIGFAVFNHTDESIIFSNQGFGLTIFRYDDANKVWEKLQLRHQPYVELRKIPAKIETWNSATDSTWHIPEEDTIALGYKQIRLYVIGKGETTNRDYGAYLDVSIPQSP